MGADKITILVSRGCRLGKMVRTGGEIASFDKARTFDLFERSIEGLTELGGWLRWLSDRSDCCVVRGAILDAARTRAVRRLLQRDPKTGDSPTLRDVPRRWLALDLDSLALPEYVAPTDLPACAAVAIERLPPAFRGASCIVQATGSHGIKPGLRLRLWYWLDRPTTGAELKAWLCAAPIDRSVFGAAQLIYTATPVFVGCRDHLPRRFAWLSGEATLRMPPSEEALATPSRKPLPQLRITSHAEAREYAYAALVQAARRISTAVEGERHSTLIAACCRLTPLLRARVVDESTAREVARRAAEAAGMDDRREIDLAISWAFTRTCSCPFGETENG
jgi:hypothetical protein